MADLWQKFADNENLTELQLDKFKTYRDLLLDWNEKFNLTTILDDKGIINKHFRDSLSLGKFKDLNKTKVIADVGSGAGFPGIPLKIKYPNLKLIIIEVNQKKISFLEELINKLDLKNTEIIDYDWRTFLRDANGSIENKCSFNSLNIEIFCARASLKLNDLLRIFRANNCYNNSELVYWASRHWNKDELSESELKFFAKIETYKVNNILRKLVFYKN